ncbi:hypothetical protein [Leptolyngbya sp. Cla-17]|uniref:hypothetical protein n=1 Tax=Leptolyngbya sp. Cla-17 TaxID=2803751 RepID=UPI0014932156|nr:hypothetical protein [Leptolyngbya sp. Cla-17]
MKKGSDTPADGLKKPLGGTAEYKRFVASALKHKKESTSPEMPDLRIRKGCSEYVIYR